MAKKFSMKLTWSWVSKILHWYLIYVLISVLIPPLIQRSFTPVSSPSFPQRENVTERAAVITDNEDALVWRLRLIKSAQKEITYTTFEIHNDYSERQVLSALYDAAQRGVDVKLLDDGLTSVLVTGTPYFRAFAASNHVTVKLYNPINLLLPARLMYRMHDKYMIVDGNTYLLGGRNTFDLFLGKYIPSQNVDYDVLVDGDGSVHDLEAYFASIWGGKFTKVFKPKKSNKINLTMAEMDQLNDQLYDLHPNLKEDVTVYDSTVPVANLRLLSGQTQPYSKDPLVSRDLLELCKDRKSIKVQTPYIICNRAMYRCIEDLIDHGTDIEIMTNAVEGGANPFGCSDYLNQKNRILKTGSTVAEWLGGQSLHGKMLLLDDETLVIGSWNLDMRSVYLDTELMLVVDSKSLNEQMTAYYDNMRASSRIVASDGSYMDGSQYAPITMSVPKKIYYGFMRVFSFFFRYLL